MSPNHQTAAPNSTPTAQQTGDHPTVADVLLHQDDWVNHLREDTLAGLQASQPFTPPVWFYDEHGSKLFSEITFLPEYYPSATERALLQQHADEVAQVSGATTLVEIGAGSAEKTMTLLAAMRRQQGLEMYVPMDCSESALQEAADMVHSRFPDVPVHYVVADFNAHLQDLPVRPRRMVAFLGSTIGNLTVDQRAEFLRDVSDMLDPDDTFLLCTDLAKCPDRLVAAYDDADGVTARFNKNALRVMNQELGADFNPDEFRHVAHWDPELLRIEMRLVACTDQVVTFSKLGEHTVAFKEGQWLQTELSHKFTPAMVDDELASAGMRVVQQWQDDAGDYLITVAAAA